MKKLFLKPAESKVKVRKPEDGAHLDPAGEYVTPSTYWRRRLKDGDVVEARLARANTPRTRSKK